MSDGAVPAEPAGPARSASIEADLALYCASSTASWPPGWSVHYLAATESTQELARQGAAAGAPHGSVWVADWQQAGRGRRGRQWLAPPGTSLLFSVLVREARLAPFAQLAACSLAVCEALEALGLAPRIKWPNDVLLRDRKVAGVLAERVSGVGAPFTIVGIGLNVAYGAATDALPPTATALDWELADSTLTSPPPRGDEWSEARVGAPIAASTPRGVNRGGAPLARGPLLADLLARLAAHLALPALAWETRLYASWLARLWRHRQTVRLADDAQVLAGVAEGVAADGALLLRLPDGQLRRITTGDVLL